MCFYSDGDGQQLDERVIHRARKPHRCGECHVEIAPGEPYRRYTGIFEGDFFAFVWCARCDFVRHAIHYVETAIEGCGEHEAWPLAFGGLGEDWIAGEYAETLGVPWRHLEEVPRW